MAQIKFPDMEPIEVDDGYVGWWAAVNASGALCVFSNEPTDGAIWWEANNPGKFRCLWEAHFSLEIMRSHNWRNLKVRVTHEVKVGYWESPEGYRAWVGATNDLDEREPVVGCIWNNDGMQAWDFTGWALSEFDGWVYMGEKKPEGW